MKLTHAAFCAVTAVVGAIALWLLGDTVAGALGFLALGLFWAAVYVVTSERRS